MKVVFRIVVLVLIISCLSSTILGADDHDHTHHEHGHFHHHYNPHNRWGSSSSSAAQPRLKTPRQALEPVFQWKQMDFEDIPAEIRSNNDSFNQYNNLPLGLTPYHDRVFVTIPRRRVGIPSTLNYVNLAEKPSPKLRSFPDYETNRLGSSHSDLASPDRIISVYRPRVDYNCDRLWFVDTGKLEYGDNLQVQQPSIWIIDLKTNKRVHRFEIPTSIVTNGISLASITIDSVAGQCEHAFAYIPDFFNFQLHVFSLAEDRMWSFTHAFFHIDPLYAEFRVAGHSYQWRDGIFSITLGPKMDATGQKLVMFHSMSSLNEFTVSSAVLKNSTNAARGYHGDDFELLGRRQEMGQSAMHAYEPKSGIVFYAEVGRNAVGCWNSKQRFNALNHDIVFRDDLNMIYPADLTLDDEGHVWVMSNTMPRFIYSRLDGNDYNYKIWRGRAVDMVRNTACAV